MIDRFHSLKRDYSTISILDLGCGGGQLLEETRKINSFILLDGVVIYRTHQRHHQAQKQFETARIFFIEPYASLNFLDRQYDVIIANQVFEYVNDIDRLL